ncbi:MAG: hypothetical protein JNM79_21450 [Burkholderiales bacterium]|nr:hypothetical protein [Burkholderiales bacterium]
MRVSSAVGRPFHAVIPFVLGPGEELSPGCVRLAADAPSVNADVPHLSGASVSIELAGSGGRIVLRTRTAINEPAVRAYLRVACGPKVSLTREWVLLLDAPGSPVAEEPRPVSPPAAVEAAVPVAAVSERTQENRSRRAKRTEAQAATAAPDTSPAARGASMQEKSARGETRPRAPAAKPPGGAFRLSLSKPGDVLPEEPPFAGLKRSDSLGAGESVQRTPEQLELLRLQARIALAEDPLAEALRLRERIAALEAGTIQLRGEIESLAASRRAAEERAERLARENRRLSAWFDGLVMVVAILASAALLAWFMRRYRRGAEAREARARNWSPDTGHESTSDDLAVQPPAPSPVAPPAMARSPVAQPLPSEPRSPQALATMQAPDHKPPSAVPALDARSEPRAEVDHARTVVLPPRTSPSTSGAPAGAPRGSAPLALEPPAALRLADNPPGEEVDFFLPPKTDASGPVAEQSGAPRYPTQRMPTLAPGAAISLSGTAATSGPAFPAAAPGEVFGASRQGLSVEEGADRAAAYKQEFEKRMFPEIATGRVKLDDARSIVVLARTYYQEDFDATKAIGLLEYALGRAADPMRIHLALLEVLRMERRVSEYQVTAQSFRRRYPEGATHWQLIAAYGRLLDPADAAYAGDPVPGLDLDTPSNWLGSTLDMTKYVLGQKVAASLREVPALTPRAAP